MRAASHEKKSPPSSWRLPVALMAADEAGHDDDDDDEDGASNLATAFNIFSNYVGMVLLSQAYCFRLSGWLAPPLLLALTAFGGYTGALIVESYKTIAARGETVPSYAQIGFHAIGPPGKCRDRLVDRRDLLRHPQHEHHHLAERRAALPSVDLQWLVAGCVALSFPVNWLRDFEELARSPPSASPRASASAPSSSSRWRPSAPISRRPTARSRSSAARRWRRRSCSPG